MKTPRLIGLLFGFIWQRSNISDCGSINILLQDPILDGKLSFVKSSTLSSNQGVLAMSYLLVNINLALPPLDTRPRWWQYVESIWFYPTVHAWLVCMQLHIVRYLFVLMLLVRSSMGWSRLIYNIGDTRVHAIHHNIQHNIESSFKRSWGDNINTIEP